MQPIMRGLLGALIATAFGYAAVTANPQSASEADTRTHEEFLQDVPGEHWQEISPDNLLVLDWADKDTGEPRQMVIRLFDLEYGAVWAGNVRAMARRGYWQDASIYRVIPGFVAQWGVLPPSADDQAGDGPNYSEPDYLQSVPAGSFVAPLSEDASENLCHRSANAIRGVCDAHSPQTRFVDGWTFASDGVSMWPAFCKSAVGVARGYAPDVGSGSTLYAVLGNDRRTMDRNLGMVGVVIAGLDHLDALPAGTGGYGMYAEQEEATAFTRIALASDLPAASRPRFRMLKTGSASHAAWLERLMKPDTFYTERFPVLDVCRADLVPIEPVEDTKN